MDPIWKPSENDVRNANVSAFMREASAISGLEIKTFDDLYAWSTKDINAFWRLVWDFCGVIGVLQEGVIYHPGQKFQDAQFFNKSRLNYAENCLRRKDNEDAIVFWGEDHIKSRLSHYALYEAVNKCAMALRMMGVEKGDRVAGFMPNIPETVIAMLATVSIGAVWSSCSPDFGVKGIVDRFGQIEPKIIFTANGYYYKRKSFESLSKIQEALQELPSVQKIVVVPFIKDELAIDHIQNAVWYNEFLDVETPESIPFESVPFDHPLFIMYSSGTTGKPKCIVHGHGGSLIQHLKEHQLHCDIKPNDRLFYYTTCGWMMWNWLVSGLASRATIMLYDGNPFYPNENILIDYAEAEKITHFGTSAKYIDALNKIGAEPIRSHNLLSIRMIASTGSPLVPESFDYVYQSVSKDVCLASISGGTDILSCFALGCAILPVYRGELQTRGLGMDVHAFNDEGKSVRCEKGELVCLNPFPSKPIYFWNDEDGEKYRKAYFDQYENIWCHGDFVEITENNGMIIYGRSDALLNPGGVRIGTAEIYRQVEQIYDVVESIVVGQQWQGDVRVVLFVKLREDSQFSEDLENQIRSKIRENTTPRHVPELIIQVADIPRTISGKISELAVTDVIHGREVKNVEALANPQALELYKGIIASQ